MAIANMGQNNYVRKPNPFEVSIINRLNRFFNTEFTIDPAAPEALIVEIFNRLIPIVRTTVTQEAHKMAMDSYHPVDIQAILVELQEIHDTFSGNEYILQRILEIKEEIERLLDTVSGEPEADNEDDETEDEPTEIEEPIDEPIEEPSDEELEGTGDEE